ncbi:MAG: helix-turn-helix domain-containing protein [Gordonia amarae]
MTDSPTQLEPGGANAIAVALGILGDEWNLWILRHAVDGCRRYGDWMARGSISNAVLSARLAGLTERGLFRKVRYSERPQRFEYHLTHRGAHVWPILLSMWAWERRWAPDSRASLPQMRHTGCDNEFVPELICHTCESAAGLHDVTTLPGPSGHWARSVPYSISRRRSAASGHPSQVLPHTMVLIGDRWSSAMLGALLLGTNRFGEFVDRTTAPPTIVVDRLTRFVELGVAVTEPRPEREDWVTYRLTDKGAAFFPVIALMIAWGQRWFRAPEGPALEFTHIACGGAFVPRLACGNCRAQLKAVSVQIVG